MGANLFSQIVPAFRAPVHPGGEEVGTEHRGADAAATGRALGEDVLRAIDEDQGTLFRGQRERSLTVHMRQASVMRLDDVGQPDGLRALGALHLQGCLWATSRTVAGRGMS